MSGRRTKQLRRECARLLGRAPRKADGHVTIRSVLAVSKVDGRPFLRRMWSMLKPAKHVQIDEFRYFKRHGRIPAQDIATRRTPLGADARRREGVVA